MAKPPSPGLQKAIDLAGGTKTALATCLGHKPMTVTHWCNRGVPAEKAKEIEEYFNGAVTREELRPDLFGPSDSGCAA